MIDNKILSWIEKRLELVEWIMAAEERMKNGHINILYQDGKIMGCDICPRERIKTKKNC